MSVREQWDGGEWQEHCCRLLGMKYGEDVQFVPDRVRGDGGMEAYRLDDAVVYQCYAPEDAFTVEAQTEAQKTKIRKDIAKLVSKADETVLVLGDDYLVRRWVLLTPEYDDKELIKYARAKSARTRNLTPRPPWCHDDFQIVVLTDEDLFAEQLATLAGMPAGSIRLIASVDDSEIVTSADEGMTGRLKGKLAANPVLAQDAATLEECCDDTLLDFVYGSRQLQILEDRYTLAFESIVRRSNLTFRTIRRRLVTGVGGPTDLDDLVRQLADNFMRDVPALAPLACEELARHYVASWLIDCPLQIQGAI
jgi:hypothetical protein